MLIARLESIAEGELFAKPFLQSHILNICPTIRRNFWELRRHFPDLADSLYASLDLANQRALERERDGGIGTNGTSSMSASLRGSNSSLNSMPSSVISTYH